MAKILEVKLSKSLYQQLLKKEEELKKLSEEVKELRAAVLKEQKKAHVSRIIVANHIFEITTRSSWKFSSKVSALKAQYKAREKYEIENKIAVPLDGIEYIRVTEV